MRPPNCAMAGEATARHITTSSSFRIRSIRPTGLGVGLADDHFENIDRNTLALHHHAPERAQRVGLPKPRPRGLADDDARAVVLVERLEPRAEIHRISN